MDSVQCDINGDKKIDVFRIYNFKSSASGFPSKSGFPILIYQNTNSGLSFLKRSDNVIVNADYKIDSCDNGKWMIIQNGTKQDRNVYTMYFEFDQKEKQTYLIQTKVVEVIYKDARWDESKNALVYGSIQKINKSKKQYRDVDKIPLEKVNFYELFASKNNTENLKITIITPKSFFYQDASEAKPKKSFLLKGDIAFVEETKGDWLFIRFEGKTITRGWMNKKNVQYLK